jgi:hypothetical protein
MKKFRFLLLDTGPIIKLFSLGIWEDFIRYCDINISRIVADNEALYTEDGARQIDLKTYEEQGLINIFDVETSMVKTFHDKFGQLCKVDIHSGEEELLAFLCSSSEDWLVCASDGAVFRILGMLGRSERGISLEEILKETGLYKNLEWQYTKKFRERYTRFGQEDFIQDRSL